MPFTISGYVLEPPRVGQSNSPFTSTPNNFVNQANPSDVAAYAAAYPSNEANPRDDYMVMLTSEVAPSLAPGLGGPPAAGPAGLLVNAGFGWTKNEVIQRFDYNTSAGRFVPLPGGTISTLGQLQATPNAQLKVQPIPQQALPAAPYRLSIGTIGSGLPADSGMNVVLVPTDSDFTQHGPATPGTVELSLATGNLNWNSTDLTSYAGQQVRWQQQQYFALGKSTGNIGTLATGPTAPAILLNPIPGAGQIPLIRIGYLPWLTAVEKPNEASFTPFPGPPSGTVEWALTTGRLNFANADVVANAGTSVYQDGTLYGRDLTLPRTSIGTINAPSAITLPSPATGDIIFCIPTASPYYQFPQYSLVTSFSSPGTQGTVQVNQNTGAVQFSSPDVASYSGQHVLVVSGDLDIDHGVSIRFFRCVVDLTGQTSGAKDMTANYTVTDAIWANPIIASPLVRLPATPVDDDTLVVSVSQGTGNYRGPLNRVDLANPTPGLGYSIDFDTNQFNFGQRKNNVLVPLLTPAGFAQLPDTMLFSSNIELSLETGPDTNVFLPLTPGVDCLVDALPGLIYFVTTEGVPLAQGSSGTFSANVFTDTSANFTLLGVAAGDFLVVQSGYALGVYEITSVLSSTTLTTDAMPPGGSGELAYQVLSGEEILADRFFETVELVDPLTQVERIRLIGNIQNATIIASGQASFPNLTTLSDPAANFTASGVLTGDTITLTALAPSALLSASSSLTATATTTAHARGSLAGHATADFAPPFDAQAEASSSLSARAHVRAGASAHIHGSAEVSASAFIPYTVRLVLTSTQTTLTPSMPFTRVTSSPYTVTRRLQIPLNLIGKTRFRFGTPTAANPSGIFSKVVTLVPNDSAFSDPTMMAQGTVEISQSTGNLNFSQTDINAGGTVYLVWKLTLGTDYTVQPQLSLITFSARMLQNEEVLLTYVTAPPVTTPPTPPAPPVVGERGTFLVRKELAQPHPQPTSTLYFNPLGRSVATNPFPSIWRGGRPQVINTQVTVNVGNPPSVPSSMTFLPDNILTNALPHGATIGPSENVYIDYYVYQAMGGESNVTVLQGPMLTAMVVITESTNSVAIPGKQAPNFPPGFLLLVNNTEVYQIGTAVYDPVANQTTVTLSSSQEFQSDQLNPPLAVVDGPTPLMSAPFAPAYFITELQPYLQVARGMNTLVLPGDRHLEYPTNGVVYFTDTGATYTDFYLITASQYDSSTNQTTVTFATTAQQQYAFGQAILNYSVRPIYTNPPTVVHTAAVPLTTQQILVFRRIPGQVGQLLTSPTGYTIDGTGTVTYASPLQPMEQFGIFYTGHVIQPAGIRLQASYSSTIAPSQNNGLLGQSLNANYTLFAPDSFYYRVETLTNFRGEVAQSIQQQAQSGTPSTGPTTSNTTSTQLFNQGRESLWFPEGDYANQDLVGRASLLFYNELINDLEDLLEDMDGRVVGNQSGRFIYDGGTGALHPPGPVTNQIDDIVEVSPAPFKVTLSGFSFSVVSIGTYQSYYLPSAVSRFYPTRAQFFGVCAAGVKTGDEVLDTQHKNLLSVSSVTTRQAFAVVTVPAAGSGTVNVDAAQGSAGPPPRPPFLSGMAVCIQERDGTFINSDSNTATVLSVPNATQLVIGGVAGAIPAGATIYRSLTDTSQNQLGQNPPDPPPVNSITFYQPGRDYNYNGDDGQLTYVKPFFPLNGASLGFLKLPTAIDCQPLQAGAYLTGQCTFGNALTAPYKFPALYGGTTDDDGDLHFPILGPNPNSEVNALFGSGLLSNEVGYISPTGPQSIEAATTPPYVGTGSLDVTGTIITDTNASYPAPIPVPGNLVRILTGLNAGSTFRHIQMVVGNSVTVDGVAFTPDSNFQYTIAVSSATATGTGTPTGTSFYNPATSPVPFTSGPVLISGNTHGTATITANTTTASAVNGITDGTINITGITPGTSGISVGDLVTGPSDIPTGLTVATIVSSSAITVSTATSPPGSTPSTEALMVGGATITGVSPGTSGLTVGDPVSGNGIPNGATITKIINSSSFTISAAATAVQTGVTLTVGPPVGSPVAGLTIDNIAPPIAQAFFSVGDPISGTGIPGGATITAINSPSSIMISQSATSSITGDFLTVTLATSVMLGWTLVMTSGANAGLRRQIVGIPDGNHLTLDFAFPSNAAGTYRIENPFDTYGDAPGDLYAQLLAALAAELTIYQPNPGPPQSETTAILAFMNLAMTDFLDSSNGQASGTTLTDTTVNFQTYGGTGVLTTMFVFIQDGPAAGFYGITTVTSATTLTVDTPFPASANPVSYRIVTLFGASEKSMQSVFAVYQTVSTFVASTLAFQALITAPVAVVNDAFAWAHGFLATDFASRLAAVNAQIASVTSSINNVEAILNSSDNLYDKRYTWIDARIDLANGLLVQEQRSAATRIATQVQVYEQLTKLLAVEGS